MKSSQPAPLLNALWIVLLFSLVLSTCAPAQTPAGAGPTEAVTLRIAALPIIEFLPFYVAEEQGYFVEHNVEVEFIPAASAAERDQMIVAGQADGMINDLLSVALYNKDQIQLQTVRFGWTASPEAPMFRVLASAQSGFTTPADLAGVPIGMSQGTVIDYVTARLLEQEGLRPEEIESMAVPKLNERMALLASGDLQAATLPEPFGTMAIEAGAVLIVDDSKYPEYGNSVISFRKPVIDEHPEAIKGFLAALEQAVVDIHEDPEAWRPLLAEYSMVPEALQDSYPMPEFTAAAVPSEAQFLDVIEWAKARGLIAKDLPYSESVTDQYLP